MALEIAEIIILGLLVDWIVRRVGIPGLVGLLILGIIGGHSVFHLFQPGILE